jgi:4-amino-4-deoxy-L-arabinose transferase-like glycosyltransferase
VQHQQSESSTPITYRHSRDLIKIIVLLLTGAIILLINIGGWDLWNPDEPRYAQVAREMLQTSNYLIPHINSEIYPDKPPLFFWLIALFSKPFGDVTAAAARMPSALAALGVILLTYFLGKKLYSPAVGLLSGIILLTTTQFFWLALRANIDVTLTLWTTLAIFLFYCGYTRKHNKHILYVLSYVCMGLANLTKGPVGFAIPLITIALYLVLEKQFRKIRELSLGWGLLIIVAVTALWLVPACITGGSDYMQNIVFKQTVGRTVDSFSHKQPFYYYVINFPADFNPWTFFIPSAVILFCRKKKQGGIMNISLPLVWFAGTFIFFSCISGKRNLYLLPLYPAAALLMAKFWYDFISPEKTTELEHPSKLITIPLYLLFGCLALFSMGFGAAITFGDKALLMKQFEIDVTNVPLYPIALLFSAGGIAGLLLLRSRARAVMPFALIIVLLVGGFLFSVVSFFPAINVFKSGKPFCDRIAQIVKPTDKLVTFRFKPESFNYFLNRTPIPVINEYSDLKKLIYSSEKFYCLIHSKYEDEAPDEDKKAISIIDKSQIGHREYYLITNKISNQPESSQ